MQKDVVRQNITGGRTPSRGGPRARGVDPGDCS